MKVCILYANARKQNTYHLVESVRMALNALGEIEYQEIFLPAALPQLCVGCFSCILQGEDHCPHSQWVRPIEQALLEADGIILASPVYALGVSGALKNVFDHLCYLWLPHRPREGMFQKAALALTTAAGAGVGPCLRDMKKSLRYWGVNRIFAFGKTMQAASWDAVSDKKKAAIQTGTDRIARRFYKAMVNRTRCKPRFMTRLLFPMMGKMIGGYAADSIMQPDIRYWREKGWLDGKKPF